MKSTQTRPKTDCDLGGILELFYYLRCGKVGSEGPEILKRNPQSLAPLCPRWRRKTTDNKSPSEKQNHPSQVPFHHIIDQTKRCRQGKGSHRPSNKLLRPLRCYMVIKTGTDLDNKR